MSSIKTFVFLDTETTGLPREDGNTTRITELSMAAVQYRHLSLGAPQRAQNKLVLCFEPEKSIPSVVERITDFIEKDTDDSFFLFKIAKGLINDSKISLGLSNGILKEFTPFSTKTVELINSFLGENPQSICLVAHNGRRFDFPIIKSEFQRAGGRFPDGLLYIDSLKAFKDLHCQRTKDPDTTGISFTLENVYKRMTNKDRIGAHRAEQDVEMLISCCAAFGDQFLTWAKNHARPLSEIAPMVPGIPIPW